MFQRTHRRTARETEEQNRAAKRAQKRSVLDDAKSWLTRNSLQSMSNSIDKNIQDRRRKEAQSAARQREASANAVSDQADLTSSIAESAKIQSRLFAGSMGILNDTAKETNPLLRQIVAFNAGPTAAYMTSSLTTQYQRVVLSRAILRQLESLTGITEAKLEALKLNTAASEFRKRTLADMTREAILQHAIQDTASNIGRTISTTITPLVHENIIDPMKEVARQYLESDTEGAEKTRGLLDRVQETRQRYYGGTETVKEARERAQKKLKFYSRATASKEDFMSAINPNNWDEMADIHRPAPSENDLYRPHMFGMPGARPMPPGMGMYANPASVYHRQAQAGASTQQAAVRISEGKEIISAIKDSSKAAERQGDNVIKVLTRIAESVDALGSDGDDNSSAGVSPRRSRREGLMRRAFRLASTPWRAGGALLGGLFQRAQDQWKDVYRKDAPNRPLMTAVDLAAGVVFSDTGEKVTSLEDIDRPVEDARTGRPLVTDSDLQAGLIDEDGNALGSTPEAANDNSRPGLFGRSISRLTSALGATAGMAGKGISGIASLGMGGMQGMLGMGMPVLGLARSAGAAGMNLVKGTMDRAGSMVSSLLNLGRKGDGLTRDDIAELVHTPLVDIHSLMQSRWAIKAGDSDGDGDRDGSYADYQKERGKDGRKAGATASTRSGGDRVSKLATLLGLGGGAAGGKAANDVASDDDDDSGIVDAAIGTTAGAAALGAGKAILRGGKKGIAKLAGKVLGKRGTAALATAGAAAAAPTAVKAAGKLTAKGVAKSGVTAVKTATMLAKRVPFLGLLLGVGFATDRALDGDWVGAAGELASGVVSMVPIVGTAASFGIDGWLMYRDFTMPGPEQDLFRSRAQYYGIDAAAEGKLRTIFEFEADLMANLADGQLQLSPDQINKVIEGVGFDPKVPNEVRYISDWLDRRVIPIYNAFMLAYTGLEHTLDDIDDLSMNEVKEVIDAYAPEAARIAQEQAKFRPDYNLYRREIVGDKSVTVSADPANTDVEIRTKKKDRVAIGSVPHHPGMDDRRRGASANRTRDTLSFSGMINSAASLKGQTRLDQLRFMAYGLPNLSAQEKDTVATFEIELISNETFQAFLDTDDGAMKTVYSDRMARLLNIVNRRGSRRKFTGWLSARVAPLLRLYLKTLEAHGVTYDAIDTATPEVRQEIASAYILAANKLLAKVGRIEPKANHDDGSDVIEYDMVKDLPDVKPKKVGSPSARVVDMSTLGALSEQYEAGNRGSKAIGYDRMGGTSYGKYQIASKTGTFDEFIAWLDTQDDANAKTVAKRLKEAGRANTGSRRGGVPAEWKALVDEGLMGDLEQRFIKASHYDPAYAKLNPEVQELVGGSEALQNVLWSTAVQHGARAAPILINRAYKKSGGDPERLIKSIYEERSTQFGGSSSKVRASVMNRFKDEQNVAMSAFVTEGEIPEQAPANDMGKPQSGVVLASAPSSQKSIMGQLPQKTIVPTDAVAKSATAKMPKDIASYLEGQGFDKGQISAVAGIIKDGNDASIEELKRITASLDKLTGSVETGLGEDGAISKMGKTLSKKENAPNNTTIVASGSQQAANAAPDRLGAIDIDVRKRGNDSHYG
jgi:hypothetical protein